MKTEDILKWGAVAVAGWWLMGKMNQPGGLSDLFGGGATVAAQPQPQPTLPPARQQVVADTTATSIPTAAAQMVSGVPQNQPMNFDTWNYQYNLVTGNQGPSPESVGVQRQNPMPAIGIRQWVDAVSGRVDLSGFRNMGRVLNAIQDNGGVVQ